MAITSPRTIRVDQWLQKGRKLPPGTIRIWGQRTMKKMGSGEWRRCTVEKWDSSSKKAKELKMADFGSPREVADMATMPKTAKTKVEARPIMEEIQAKGAMTNKNSPALKATLSKTSINKILNNKAKNQSFNEKAHILAAANIDRLFFYAIEPWKFELDPRKQNVQLSNRRFLYAPMEFEEKIIPVKLTLMEYQNKDVNLYSLEAIEAIIIE